MPRDNGCRARPRHSPEFVSPGPRGNAGVACERLSAFTDVRRGSVTGPGGSTYGRSKERWRPRARKGPLLMQVPSYYLPRPPLALTPAMLRAFAQLPAAAVLPAHGQ